MAFRCPYCQFRIAVKTAPKPGKYTPTCPKCKAKIALTVPNDTAAEWLATAIPGEGVSATDATEVGEVTGDFAPRPPAPVDQTAMLSNSIAAGDRTGAFIKAEKTKVDGGETVAHTAAGELPMRPGRHDGPATEVDMPNTLGGYEVVKELGRGGMGAVYLARQVSLDRPVALKVMNSRWASDPIFLARFTREAFAAAQLVHHNVVQIYDIGEQEGINFFSMEFVDGRSLGEMLKRDGKVDIETAIGYALQAARGLKFAHDRGMIHRDVKPDNLMLNVHGVVKVADLGLVKTPTMTPEDDMPFSRMATDPGSLRSMSGLRSLPSEITMAHTAMGSPAYMSPEQCKDAATVDPRADVYSLGCSLYALLAGRPPFQGDTVFDLMAKHATVSPEALANVPKNVNALVLRCLAKRPDDRFQTMDELIAALEQTLPNKGATTGPTVEHLNSLEASVRRFQSAPFAKIRRPLILAFFLGSLVAAVVGLFAGSGLVTGAIVALILETVSAYFIVAGVFGKSYLFRRVREWAFSARFTDWAIAVLGGLALLLVLFWVGLLWVWLGTAVVAVGIAFLFHFVVDRRLAAQRRQAIDDGERLFKRLRIGGMDEDALRHFVAKNAGRAWEEYFEALFGFEAKMSVRPAVEAQAGARLPRFAAWREPLLARLDRAQQARREQRTRKVLQKVEARKLEAEGVDRREAKVQAEAAAEQMVEQTALIKASPHKPVNVRAMLEQAEKPAKRLPKPPAYQLRRVVAAATGWKARFVVALLLITVGALWVRNQVDTTRLQQDLGSVHSAETSDSAQAAAKNAAGSLSGLLSRGNSLSAPVAGWFLEWVDCLNPLVAGIIVLLSTFNRRALGVWLQLAGAAVALLGHLLIAIPDIGPIQPHHLTMLIGSVLAVLGIVVSRK